MPKIATPFRAVFNDGRKIEGTTLPIDYLVAERHMGRLPPFAGEMYATMLACKRKGVEYSALDDFVNDLADYIGGEDLETGKGAGPASEPISPSSPTGSAAVPATSPPA